MELDVVLLPQKALNRQLGGLVSKIGKNIPLAIAVDGNKLLPHISLLHIEAGLKKIPKILKVLEDLTLNTKGLELQFGKKNMAAGVFKSFFQITIRPNQKLFALHKSIVKNISPLRQGMVLIPPKSPTPLQKRYLKKYGVGNVLEFFSPHFTLGKIKNANDTKKLLALLSKSKFKSFLATRLALAKVDDNHQVTKVIKEFKLK